MKFKDRINKWWHTSSGRRVVAGKSAYVYMFKSNYHREDGPAIVFDDGSYEYLIHGIAHREGGPAIYYSLWDKKLYFVNGKLHRLDGPAIEYRNNNNAWFYKGYEIDCTSQKEFERKIKLLAFC
jgi:hypothetical protein